MSTIHDDPTTHLSRDQAAKAPTGAESKAESTTFATKTTQGEGQPVDYLASLHGAVGAQPAAGCRSENANQNHLRTTAFSDLFSGINFLPGEDPQNYVTLKTDLFRQFMPCGRSQEKLIESITKAVWKLRRVQQSSLDRALASDTPE